MLASDVINRVRGLAGDMTALQFTDAQLIDWINDGIKECVVDNRLSQKTATQNLVVGTDTYNLPADIFKLYSIIVNGEKIKVLTLQEWEELNAGYGGQPPNNPTGATFQCYVWAGKLVVYPIPDQAYTLKINYIYEPAVVVAGTDLATVLPPAYHLRLVTYCLAQVAFQDDDINKYNLLMQQFTQGVLDLKGDHTTEEDLYPFISVSSRDAGEDFGLAFYG